MSSRLLKESRSTAAANEAAEFNNLLDRGISDDQVVTADLLESSSSFTTFVSRTYESCVVAISWLMYGLHHDTWVPAWLSITCIIIETLQWMSFGFFKRAALPWNSSWSYGFASGLEYLTNFLGFHIIGWYIALGWVVCIPLLALFVVFAQRKLRWIWPMKFYKIFVVSTCSFFFFPVAGSHMRMVFGCLDHGSSINHYNFPSLECWEGLHIAFACISIFCLVVVIFACVVVTLTYFELNPNQREDMGDNISFSARQNARGDVLNLVGRIVLLFCFVTFSSFQHSEFPLSFLVLFIGLALVAYNITHIPYYKIPLQMVVLFQATVIAWVGICMIVTNFRGDTDKSSVYLLYFCIPFLFALSILATRSRIDQILYWGNEKLTAPHLIALKARLVMTDGMHKTSLDEIWTDNTDERLQRYRFKLCREVERIFYLGIQRFPDDAMLHLAFASFYLFYTGNKPLAYRELSSAESIPHQYDIRFMLFLYRARAELETSWGHSSDVQSYIEFKERKMVADEAARLAARSMLDFWNELLRSIPNVNRMVRLGTLARQAMTQTQNSYDRLLQINPTSVPVLRAYGGFVIDFRGDLATSSEMLHRADDLEEARQNMVTADLAGMSFLDQQKSSLDIFDERNAVVGMSVEKESFAHIISLNSSCRRMFGYPLSTELLNRNIAQIIPEPIQSMHDSIVAEFLSRNTTTILNTTRVVLALHKNGAIFPINLFIRWADTSASKVIGVMSRLQTDEEQLMFDRENGGAVTYCTQNAYSWFGFTREMLTSREIFLGQLIPHMAAERSLNGKEKRRRELIFTRAGSRTGVIVPAKHHISGRVFLVRVWITCVMVRNREISFIRISRSVTKDNLEGEENCLHFGEQELKGEGVLMYGVEFLFQQMARGTQEADNTAQIQAQERVEDMSTPSVLASLRRSKSKSVSEDLDDDEEDLDRRTKEKSSTSSRSSRRSGSSSRKSKDRKDRKGRSERRDKTKSKKRSSRDRERRAIVHDMAHDNDEGDIDLESGLNINDPDSRITSTKPLLRSNSGFFDDSESDLNSQSDGGSDLVSDSDFTQDSDSEEHEGEHNLSASGADSSASMENSRSHRSSSRSRKRSRRESRDGRSRGRNRSRPSRPKNRSHSSRSRSRSRNRSRGQTRSNSQSGLRNRHQRAGEFGDQVALRQTQQREIELRKMHALEHAHHESMNKLTGADMMDEIALDELPEMGYPGLMDEGDGMKRDGRSKAQQRIDSSAAYTMTDSKKARKNQLALSQAYRSQRNHGMLNDVDAESDVSGSLVESEQSDISGAESNISSLWGTETDSHATGGHRLIISYINEDNESVTRRLSKASGLGLFTIFVVFSCWLAMFLVTDASMRDSRKILEMLTLAGHRRHVAFDIAANARSLELASYGFYTAGEIIEFRENLKTSTEILEGLESALYDDRMLSQKAKDFLYIPTITVETLVGSTTVLRKHNLRELGQMYISNGYRAINRDLSQFDSRFNPVQFFITHNGPTSVLEAYTTSMNHFKDALNETYDKMWWIQILTYGIAIFVVVSFILFVLRPTVYSLEENNSSVLKLFLAMPRPVVRLLQRRFLLALRNQGEDEDDDEEAINMQKIITTEGANDVSDAESSISTMSGDSDASDFDNSNQFDVLESKKMNTNNIAQGSDFENISPARITTLNAWRKLTLRRLILKYAILIGYICIYIIVSVIIAHLAYRDNNIIGESLVGASHRHVTTAQSVYFIREHLITPRDPYSASFVTAIEENQDQGQKPQFSLFSDDEDKSSVEVAEKIDTNTEDNIIGTNEVRTQNVTQLEIETPFMLAPVTVETVEPSPEVPEKKPELTVTEVIHQTQQEIATIVEGEQESDVNVLSPNIDQNQEQIEVALPSSAVVSPTTAPLTTSTLDPIKNYVASKSNVTLFGSSEYSQAMIRAVSSSSLAREFAMSPLLQGRINASSRDARSMKTGTLTRSTVVRSLLNDYALRHTTIPFANPTNPVSLYSNGRLQFSPLAIYYYDNPSDMNSYMDYGYVSDIKNANAATKIANEAIYLSQLFIRSMVYGNKDDNIKEPTDEKQKKILYDDLCEIVPDALSGEKLFQKVISESHLVKFNADCTTFIGGINTRGLMEVYILGIMEARQLARSLYAGELSMMFPEGQAAAAIYNNPAYPTPPPAVTDPLFLATKERLAYMSKILEMDASVGAVVSTNNFFDVASAKIDNFNLFRQIFLICFVVVLFALHLVVLFPIFSEMSERTKHIVSLLLVIPPDVVSRVTNIQKFVKEAAKRIL